MEYRKISFGEFANTAWFSSAGDTFWVRLYNSVAGPFEIVQEAFALGLNQLNISAHFALSFARMNEVSVTKLTPEISVNEEGTLICKTEISEAKLPASTYLVIATPHHIGDEQPSDHETRLKLDRFVALLRSVIGFSAARELIHEGEYRMNGQANTLYGPPLKVPQSGDGPFLHPSVWRELDEIFRKSLDWRDETRDRVDLSLEYMNRAVEESDYYRYWTALEVLCGGGANTILDKIAKCYDFETSNEADLKTGFNALRRWRIDLIHKGRRTNLSADVERYLQLLYIDLLRQELWMSAKHHAVCMAREDRHQLSALGLSQMEPENDYRPSMTDDERDTMIQARNEEMRAIIERWKNETKR